MQTFRECVELAGPRVTSSGLTEGLLILAKCVMQRTSYMNLAGGCVSCFMDSKPEAALGSSGLGILR